MKKMKLIGLFVVGFVVGGVAVGAWSAYLFSRLTIPKEVGTALEVSRQAEWLAELRLNEPQTVIKDMENIMDIGVSTISLWAEVRPPDEKTRKARDRFLTGVKVYHQSYPVAGNDAARINALLATVPGRNPQSPCKSGLCRLDEQRLATLNTTTNSP